MPSAWWASACSCDDSTGDGRDRHRDQRAQDQRRGLAGAEQVRAGSPGWRRRPAHRAGRRPRRRRPAADRSTASRCAPASAPTPSSNPSTISDGCSARSRTSSEAPSQMKNNGAEESLGHREQLLGQPSRFPDRRDHQAEGEARQHDRDVGPAAIAASPNRIARLIRSSRANLRRSESRCSRAADPELSSVRSTKNSTDRAADDGAPHPAPPAPRAPGRSPTAAPRCRPRRRWPPVGAIAARRSGQAAASRRSAG